MITTSPSVYNWGKNLMLQVGSSTATVNGPSRVMQRPAEVTGGRTYIPLRFVSESLGAIVNWDQSTNTVTVDLGQVP